MLHFKQKSKEYHGNIPRLFKNKDFELSLFVQLKSPNCPIFANALMCCTV